MTDGLDVSRKTEPGDTVFTDQERQMKVSPKGGGILFWLWGIRGCSVFPSKVPVSARWGVRWG